jgi:ABC-2 type transport system permease protein
LEGGPMLKRLRKYAVITRVSASNELTYRANFYARFGFYTLFIYTFMSLWRAVYAEGGVRGYTHTQMVWYLIMTEFIAFTGGGEGAAINEEVKTGAIVYQLGRPVHYVFYRFAAAVGQMLPKLAAFGLLAAVLGFAFVGPLYSFRLAGILPLIVSVALGVTINYFFLMLIGLSAFIMEDNAALFLVYQKVNFLLGLFLPVEFLPEWLRPVALNMPFSYVYWAPAKLFVDYSPELFLQLLPRQLFWAVIACGLVLMAYNAAIKRLQINGG